MFEFRAVDFARYKYDELRGYEQNINNENRISV